MNTRNYVTWDLDLLHLTNMKTLPTQKKIHLNDKSQQVEDFFLLPSIEC